MGFLAARSFFWRKDVIDKSTVLKEEGFCRIEVVVANIY